VFTRGVTVVRVPAPELVFDVHQETNITTPTFPRFPPYPPAWGRMMRSRSVPACNEPIPEFMLVMVLPSEI
jgi:hypothetical protein